MITGLLRTKIGFVLLVLFVVGTFATLSALKRRNTAHRPATVAAAGVPGQPGAEDAALLKRAQDSARSRAEDIRADQEVNRSVTATSDQFGRLYRRRTAASPTDGRYAVEAPPEAEAAPAGVPAVQPSLRIHGRRAAPEPDRGPVDRAIDALAPKVPGFQEFTKHPFASPIGAPAGFGPGAQGRRPPPDRFVPYGRLIKAELVMTLESSSEAMPLIGLITEPVYNNGKRVIPAGTEVHSTARPSMLRDRIVSGEEWCMVFPREGSKPNGRQLTFTGVALDREDQDANGLTWPVTDGSFGLRGRVLRRGQTEEEVLIFAAEALKAASATLMERETTVAGTRIQNNATNAALAGGQAVLTRFAERLMHEIELNGAYVQVPAGKQFYLYPKQVIDPDRAEVPAYAEPE